jgi:DNA-binding response OmpR family regulator
MVMPAAKAEATPLPAQVLSFGAFARPLRPHVMPTRVLVVDDSPTIRRVVSAVLERHGIEAIQAADGQIALEKLLETTRVKDDETQDIDTRIDLVLVDFVMPRMNGFQFCRALRQNEDLRTTPVVLMSAKSDRIREHFVQQTGAMDAITKPFDAQALLAVIENAIRRSEQWRTRGEALAAGIPEDFEAPESVRAASTHGESTARKVRVAYDVLRRVADAIAPALAKGPSEIDEAKLATELATHMTPEQVRDLAESIRVADFGGPKIGLSGDMEIIPIGAALQLLQIEAQSGVLIVTDGKTEVTIAMRSGLIDLVQARGAGNEFRLGRYFVEHGLVSPGDIDRILRDNTPTAPPPPPESTGRAAPTSAEARSGPREEQPSSSRKLLGDLLVDSGRVTRDQLREALARQSSELVYEVLRWPRGRFDFRRDGVPPLAESAQLGLPVASVVMEGFRRVDEWRLVEAGLGSFESVLQRDAVAVDAVGLERLAKPEQRLLDMVDGERTVREIIEQSHMSSFDACKVLFQLLEARLVRRRAA